MSINGISHGYFDLDAHFTTPTDSSPFDLRLLPCTITHFQSDNGSGYMVMGCIGHELPYAFELDFPIQSPYALHSCGPWHSYNVLSDDGSHALCFAAAPPFAFIKPRLLSTNKRFWSANPPFFFLVHKLLCHIWSGLFIPIKEKLFFFNNTTLHVHMDRSFPPRGTNFALGYLPHDVLGCPSCSLTRLASSSILGPLKRVPLS